MVEEPAAREARTMTIDMTEVVVFAFVISGSWAGVLGHHVLGLSHAAAALILLWRRKL